MCTKSITEQLDELIDELLLRGDVRSSSLVSMLTAVRESVSGGYHVALARRVWDARNLLESRYLGAEDFGAEADAEASAEVVIPAAALAE